MTKKVISFEVKNIVHPAAKILARPMLRTDFDNLVWLVFCTFLYFVSLIFLIMMVLFGVAYHIFLQYWANELLSTISMRVLFKKFVEHSSNRSIVWISRLTLSSTLLLCVYYIFYTNSWSCWLPKYSNIEIIRHCETSSVLIIVHTLLVKRLWEIHLRNWHVHLQFHMHSSVLIKFCVLVVTVLSHSQGRI